MWRGEEGRGEGVRSDGRVFEHAGAGCGGRGDFKLVWGRQWRGDKSMTTRVQGWVGVGWWVGNREAVGLFRPDELLRRMPRSEDAVCSCRAVSAGPDMGRVGLKLPPLFKSRSRDNFCKPTSQLPKLWNTRTPPLGKRTTELQTTLTTSAVRFLLNCHMDRPTWCHGSPDSGARPRMIPYPCMFR